MAIAPARPLRILCAALLAACACTRADDAPFASNADAERTIRDLLVASPYKISERARAGTIRYTLEHARVAWNWPETGEQHVETRGDRTTLTICGDCGRETAPSTEELARYLAPNAWVDSDDRALRSFARAAGGHSVESRMSALVLAVRMHMNGAIDFRHYASASEALASREGDCTEFAVLLAAAARARGIPARVVAGLGYDGHFLGRSHVFVPHMWVQVWNGERWRSHDAALERFDAGHIALAVGDGRPEEMHGVMAMIGKLRIVDAAGVPPARDGAGSGESEVRDSPAAR